MGLGLKERLAAAKTAEQEKQAAEKVQAEKEARGGELSAELEMLEASFSEAEKEVAEADEVIAEIGAAENLDDETAEILAEAKTVKDRMEAVKSELERVRAELGRAEGGEAAPAEVVLEAVAEAPVEKSEAEAVEIAKEAPMSAENERGTEPMPESLAVSKEEIERDNEAVETYIDEKGQQIESRRKSVVKQVEYIEKHPEKISEYTDRIKENIPTSDKGKDKVLFEDARTLAKHDKSFRQKIIQKFIDRGIIKTAKDEVDLVDLVDLEKASPVLREMEDEIISTSYEGNHGPVNEKERYPLQLAYWHYRAANEYLFKNQRNLVKLGEEGEEALISTIDNYLDGVEKYLDYPDMVLEGDIYRGLGAERPLSQGIPGALERIVGDMKNISNSKTSQAISERVVRLLEKAKKLAKRTEKGIYVEMEYDNILKKISGEKQ